MNKKLYQLICANTPLVCVDLAVICQDGSGIYLSKRAIQPAKDLWQFHGGRILKGESIIQALHRKAAEELRVEIKILYPLDIVEVFYPEYHAIALVYAVKALTSNIRTCTAQFSETKIFREPPRNSEAHVLSSRIWLQDLERWK